MAMDTTEQKKEQLDEALANKLKEEKSLDELKENCVEKGCELSDEELDDIAGGKDQWICIRDWNCATQTIKPGPPIV